MSTGGELIVRSDRAGCRRRLAALRHGLHAATGVEAVLVTGPGAVAALTGVWLETGTVLPGRQPWLLVGPDGPPRLLVHDFELELARRRCPPELAQITPVTDRCRAVRQWQAGLGAAVRLGADGSGVPANEQPLPPDAEHREISDRLPELLRGYHAPELAQVRAGAAVLELAVATVLRGPCAPERELAARLAAEVFQSSGDWYDLVPIASSGPRLRIPHARPTGRTPEQGDLCRIGVRARYGPYHLMCVRSAVVRGDRYLTTEGVCGAAGADAAAVLDALRPGASYRELAGALPVRTGRLAIPLAQGMGFAFKEPPQLGADRADTLAEGDLVLVSIVLTEPTGARAYWQNVTPVGAGADG
ncbi:MAG: M24 family metallopeptidase [Micromonosporaceae bacterium]|nr:M24 family metallopeptidase [Micromonosporaceae bacterium]